MKIHIKTTKKEAFSIFQLLTAIVLIAWIITSCQKETSKNNFLYLQTSQKVKSVPVVTSKLLFTYMTSGYPDAQSIINNCLFDYDIYKLTYKTTFKGSKITASGLICIPKTDGKFPILSFQNGTNAKEADAPSNDLANPLFGIMQSIASNGYIILMPDYIGFGASSNILHPYHHRESNNSAVIDLIRAGEEFLSMKETSASGNGKLFIMGYSQGGWSTLSVLNELENNPLSTEAIQAASCGAGGYNLMAVTDYLLHIDTFPSPLYLAYFVQSHRVNGFLDISLTDVFKEPYASKIPGLFNHLLSNSEINSQLNDTISKFLSDNLLTNFDQGSGYAGLRNELTVNSVPAWNTTSKILFAAGTADLDVPPSVTLNTYNAFIGLGADSARVRLSMYARLTHETALIPWGIETIIWFNSLK